MILTLKVTSAALNYQDGSLKEEELKTEFQRKYRLVKMPSLVAYFGYCLNCGTHLAGPVYEYKEYLDWTEGKGVSASSDSCTSLYLVFWLSKLSL
jgi:lysophospholipid acyltransferase